MSWGQSRYLSCFVVLIIGEEYLNKFMVSKTIKKALLKKKKFRGLSGSLLSTARNKKGALLFVLV